MKERKARLLKSPVWQWFTKRDALQAECTECEAMVSCKSGTTSAMFFHLMKKHPELYKLAKSVSSRDKGGLKFNDMIDDNFDWKVESSDLEDIPGPTVPGGSRRLHPAGADDGEGEEEEEENPVDNVSTERRSSSLPKEAVLAFLSEQTEASNMFMLPDVYLRCSDGNLPAHRLVLGAISPFLSSILSPLTDEEADHVYIEGVTYEYLLDFINWVYKGGVLPKHCVEVLSVLGVQESGHPPPLSHSSHKVTSVLSRKNESIKEEPQETEGLTSYDGTGVVDRFGRKSAKRKNLSSLEIVPSIFGGMPGLEFTKLEYNETLAKSLLPYFLDILGDHSKFKCLLCDEAVVLGGGGEEGEEEEGRGGAMWLHFQRKHPAELDKINSERLGVSPQETGFDSVYCDTEDGEASSVRKRGKPKKMKNKRSKVWLYFNIIGEGESECRKCNFRLSMEGGTTSSMIYHLRSKHEEIFNLHDFNKTDSGAVRVKRTVKRDEDREEESDEVKPIRKKRKLKIKSSKKSKIWLYFNSLAEGFSECKHCKETLPLEKGTTAKMIYHLRSKHTELFTEFEEKTAGEKELCEICSERVDNGKMIQHNYSDHFETWAESAKAKLNLLYEQLLANSGSSENYQLSQLQLSQLYAQGDLENNLVCRQCQTVVQADPTEMEQHATAEHPELGLAPRAPLNTWLYFKWCPEQQGGSCQLCSVKGLPETSFYSHLQEKHVLEFDDLESWTWAFRETEDKLSFRTALLLEKYAKNGREEDDGENSRHEDAAFRTCLQCRKVFSSSSAMRYHVKVVHTGAKPFTCSICEKSFGRKDTLESHILSHSDLKPFMCSICGKQFKSKTLRDLHERRERGEKRFGCSFCPKKFAHGQQKRNHERTHTGEKPYDCEHCGRLFAQKHQLTTHLRTHTGERPYTCPKCPQRFKHLSTKRNHKCTGEIKPLAEAVRDDMYRISVSHLYP